MALWQGRSKRKPSGGRLRPLRKKRKQEIAREPYLPAVGATTWKTLRVRGGNTKVAILAGNTINVLDPKSRTSKRGTIQTVNANPANPNYVQRNILTKGAVVLTDLGRVRITSRPGQDGVLNGILVGS